MSAIFSDMEQFHNIKSQSTNPISTSSQIAVKDALPASPVDTKPNVNSDTLEILSKKKEKKGPIKTIKTFISNVKKYAASATEYAKGIAKGFTTGAIAGSLIYTGGSIINKAGEIAAKNAKTVAQEAPNAADTVVKKFPKVPNKALAIAAAVGALAINIWNASLNASERRSEIEHRYIGHQQ